MGDVGPDDFVSFYQLDVDWTLTWFPIGSSADLHDQVMRAGSFSHKSTVFGGPGGRTHTFGLGQGDGDAMAPDGAVRAFITVRVDDNMTFHAELEAALGSGSFSAQRRIADLVLEENVRVPFMINVPFQGLHSFLQDTGLSFQGLLVTGPRELTAGTGPDFHP